MSTPQASSDYWRKGFTSSMAAWQKLDQRTDEQLKITRERRLDTLNKLLDNIENDGEKTYYKQRLAKASIKDAVTRELASWKEGCVPATANKRYSAIQRWLAQGESTAAAHANAPVAPHVTNTGGLRQGSYGRQLRSRQGGSTRRRQPRMSRGPGSQVPGALSMQQQQKLPQYAPTRIIASIPIQDPSFIPQNLQRQQSPQRVPPLSQQQPATSMQYTGWTPQQAPQHATSMQRQQPLATAPMQSYLPSQQWPWW